MRGAALSSFSRLLELFAFRLHTASATAALRAAKSPVSSSLLSGNSLPQCGHNGEAIQGGVGEEGGLGFSLVRNNGYLLCL